MWMQECASCASSKNGGLQLWMRHLTEDHVLPSEWPSDRASRLTGPAAMKPYTTITESKKKRRKDSIPRPLNSFMLFAQHIRRNVLRVFSDASNSVISQQLGDLWRTVPLRLRNQYDEEATRLVKIHQLEFPHYKYQPKKRVQPQQHLSVTNTTSSATSTIASSCNSGIGLVSTPAYLQPREMMDCARSFNRGTQLRDAAADSGDSFTVRPRMLGITSFNSGITYLNDQSANKQQQQVFDSNMRVISPQKCSVKALYTRPVDSKRSVPSSLSSVLPPLLTPSLSCPATTYSSRAGSLSSNSTDSFQAASYDSAYASGINSSSSSSASSPAVGELLSPAKSQAGIPAAVCNKTSPVRRKIQLIPMRPQSQQLPPVHGQQTIRQRFLSANNNNTNEPSSPSNFTGQLIESPTTSEPVYFLQSSNHQHQSFFGVDSVDEVDSGIQPVTIVPHQQQQHQRQLFTPVFVKLEADGVTNSAEELILALPPGTTIIQTIQNTPEQLQSIPTGSRRVYVASCGKPTPTVSAANRAPIQLIQPVKFMSVIGRTVRGEMAMLSGHGMNTSTTGANETHSTFEDLSPPLYSSNSSCSSVLSPLSNDVFLPLHHDHHQHQLSTSYVLPPGSSGEVSGYSRSLIRESTFIIKSEDNCHQPPQRDQVLNVHQFEMEVDPSDGYRRDEKPYVKMEEDDYLCSGDTVFGTTMLNGSVVTSWPKTTTRNKGDRSSTAMAFGAQRSISPAAPLLPLTIDVVKSSPSPCASVASSSAGVLVAAAAAVPTPNSEFPMSAEDDEDDGDQFDTSFDAMMNSIDITTFLPGTFSTTDDQLLVDADFDRDLSTSVPSTLETETVVYERSVGSLNYARPDVVITESSQSTQLAPSIYSHSPLSDLDALDKSSLFVIKQEWPIVA